MGYKLEKPYTQEQRADFVCQYQGKTPIETDNAFYMLENHEKVENDVIIDISETAEYKTKIKTDSKKLITLTYKDKFNEFDGVYAARVVRGLSTSDEMNTKRTALQAELTTKLREIDNG